MLWTSMRRPHNCKCRHGYTRTDVETKCAYYPTNSIFYYTKSIKAKCGRSVRRVRFPDALYSFTQKPESWHKN